MDDHLGLNLRNSEGIAQSSVSIGTARRNDDHPPFGVVLLLREVAQRIEREDLAIVGVVGVARVALPLASVDR
jgi:hypothetical protein